MTKEIQLTQGKMALVDDEDFERVNEHKWFAQKGDYSFYAINRKIGRMHRFILEAPQGMDVDHKNFDGLDNRKNNIRVCTEGQNSRNRRKGTGNFSSDFKGVINKATLGRPRFHPWAAYITLRGKLIYLGAHKTEEEAARIWDQAAIHYHGEFAFLNFPDTKPDPDLLTKALNPKKLKKRRVVCKRGHSLENEKNIVHGYDKKEGRPRRQCRACRDFTLKRWRQKRKDEKAQHV